MCGIAGFKCFGNIRPEKEEIKNLLIGIMTRGTDATGMAWIEKNKLQVYKSPMKASEFIKTIDWQNFNVPSTLLMHTRAATKGQPINNMNNHPIFNKDGMAITHNGIIDNDDLLFSTCKLTRDADVDSEIILRLIEDKWWKSIKRIEKVSGSFAVAAIYEKRPDELILSRHSNPLVIKMDKKRDILFWASTKEILKAISTEYYRGFIVDESFCYEIEDNTAILVNKSGVADIVKLDIKRSWQIWGNHYENRQKMATPDFFTSKAIGINNVDSAICDICEENPATVFFWDGTNLCDDCSSINLDECLYCGKVLSPKEWKDGYCRNCLSDILIDI